MADDAAWADQAEAEISYARTHFSRDALRGALLEALAPGGRPAADRRRDISHPDAVVP
jgi:hypothetical protein